MRIIKRLWDSWQDSAGNVHPMFLIIIGEKAKMNFIGNENDISPYVFPVS